MNDDRKGTATETRVPPLRFPGFTAPWEGKRLGEVATFAKGRGVSKADLAEDGETPCIRYAELYTSYGSVITGVVSRTHTVASDLLFSKGGEVIIPASGETAEDIATAAVVIPSGVALGGDLNVLTTAEDGAFLARYLSSSLKRRIAAVAQGNSVVHLYPGQLAGIVANLPHLTEQQKIAGFLGSVDRWIDGLRARRDALADYKRGVMQHLFSRQIRFTRPDGTPFPEWQEKRLGEVADIIGGGTPDTLRPDYWDGDIQWFTPTEIKTKYLTSSTRAITQRGLSKSSASLLPAGTILLSSRATVGDVGILTQPAATNQGFQSLVVKSPDDNEFWFYWVSQNRHEFLKRANGSTFLEISKASVAEIPALKPHPEEQRKIAGFLGALDRRIDAVTTQITAAGAFKRGLLQQMFVRGEKR